MDLSLPPALLAANKDCLTYLTLGSTLSTALFGITLLQAYIYYRRYVSDSTVLKALVAALVCLDTATTILTVHGLYHYAVEGYMEPQKFLVIVWSLTVENGLSVAISFLVQCYFCQRLWYLSRKNVIVTGIIALLSIGNLGAGIGLTVVAGVDSSVFVFASTRERILVGVCNACSSLCDLLIAGGLCYYLHTSRSQIRQSNRLIDKLMVYAVHRGFITTSFQILQLATTLALPDRFVFLLFTLPANKLYTNSLLATLNVRHSLTTQDPLELGSRGLVLSNTTAGTNGSQACAAPIRNMASEDKLPFGVKAFSVRDDEVDDV